VSPIHGNTPRSCRWCFPILLCYYITFIYYFQ
jgi:hypothetical protein